MHMYIIIWAQKNCYLFTEPRQLTQWNPSWKNAKRSLCSFHQEQPVWCSLWMSFSMLHTRQQWKDKLHSIFRRISVQMLFKVVMVMRATSCPSAADTPFSWRVWLSRSEWHRVNSPGLCQRPLHLGLHSNYVCFSLSVLCHTECLYPCVLEDGIVRQDKGKRVRSNSPTRWTQHSKACTTVVSIDSFLREEIFFPLRWAFHQLSDFMC